MAEQDRASFGVFPQLRRNRTVQDPEAAKNAPLAALRGFVSGVAGAPGDLESIAYMPYDYFRAPSMSELVTGEKKTKTFFPTSEEIEKKIPFRGTSPVEQAFTGAGQLAGGFYYGRGSPLRVLAESPQILKKAGMDFARSIAPVNVVKPTGKGNLTAGTGSLDEAINKGNLKRNEYASQDIPLHQMELEELLAKEAETPGRFSRRIPIVEQSLRDLQRESALNNWVESNLKNYVQKQMGTPDDPVRALAEQGIAHSEYPAGRFQAGNITKRRRKEAGFPEEGLAQSDLAKRWERLSDATINPIKAGDIRERMAVGDLNSSKYETILDENPWLSKLPDSEVVNMTNRYNFRELGFDHIMDVLREDLVAGRIRPNQLNKVSMEQAVRRTHEYDQELAAKMNSSRAAAREGLPVYKEYPEGYKWIELNKPGSFSAESEAMGHSVRGYEPPKGHPDWVEGSSDSGSSSYGLGGWEAIKSGDAKVYSLVDSKGEPHVTIEVGKARPTQADIEKQPQEVQDEFKRRFDNWVYGIDYRPSPEEIKRETELLFRDMKIPTKEQISQIKGKGNARPVEKYDQFTQDFVKSGKWSDVNDLKNTGLFKADPDELGTYLPTDTSLHDMRGLNRTELFKRAKQSGLFPEGQNYLSRDEWEDILRKQYLSEQSAEAARKTQMGTPPTEGDIKGFMDGLEPEMARGGPVHLSKGTKAAEIVEATAEGIANLFAKYSGKAPKEAKEAMPLVLPRAAPKTSQEINEIAERVARQMIGEHVTPQGKTVNLAGRSKKEAERVKQLQFELKPTGTVAQAQVNKPQIGDVNVAFPGDQTISDTILDTLQGETINSLQQGGAKYGLGQRHLIDPEFWKSNIGPALGIQGRIDDLYAKYMPERMVGEHLAMGPMSNNFAMHFADANLKALDWSKLKPKDVAIFDSHIADGYVIKKKNKTTGEVTTKHVKFPDWPGLASPDLAFEAMQKNPEMRKWFNNRMKTPDLTQPLGLPNGRDIEYAISEPAIRNLEINMTGLNTGILKPNALVEPLGNIHNTYTHRILGEAIGPREVLSPFTMSYPDATAHVLRTQSPSDFTGTIQKVFPHQVVDQQYLDEMGKYQDKVKQITGYQKGGAVKKFQAGGKAKVVKSLADLFESYYPKGAKTTVIETIEAPAVVIPKGIGRVKEAVRATKGDFGARRVERAADEIPNLEKMFTDEALREAFSGDNAKAVMTMNPADFEKYAARLHYKSSVGPNAAKLASQGDLSKHTMSTEDYLKFLRELPEGFNDIPYLQISKQETGLPLMPYITGHEGRHRSRALAGAGQQRSLVQLMPNYELREPLPRRSQEEYIEALKEEMAMTKNKVKPEKYFDDSLPKNLLIERPPIDLPDFYAKGGAVEYNPKEIDTIASSLYEELYG